MKTVVSVARISKIAYIISAIPLEGRRSSLLSLTFTDAIKAFCVLQFAKLEAVVTERR